MIIFFHSVDLDGICSAAVVYNYMLLNFPKEECKLYGINYGDLFPWELIKDQEVIMVDFSLTRDEMIRLQNESKDLTWIDHHKSAINDMEGINIPGIQEVGKGACMLSWMYYHNMCKEEEVPIMVKYISDDDVWNHSNPNTWPFQYGMQLLDPDPYLLAQWLRSDKCEFIKQEVIERAIEAGQVIIKYREGSDKRYAKQAAFETSILGPENKLYRAIAINKLQSGTELFKSVWDPDKYDIMIAFGFTNGGYNFSLRSMDDGPDVSEIAKFYKGGGHPRAAGFRARDIIINKDQIFIYTELERKI
jgi:oligoribonuclease NrnB/cAMP/cGMP phosphodiesterase (DHH superfamily)